MSGIVEFLRARLDEDEQAARECAEMFPAPWEVADRGWRVRIYAGDVPTPDYSVDDEDAMTTRQPVVMEVEPDRNIDDPQWLSTRVEMVRRHDPARVLREVEAKRAMLDEVERSFLNDRDSRSAAYFAEHLAAVYADHPDYRQEWA